MVDRIPMTSQGLIKLKEELHKLKKTVRPRVIAAIAEARSHGDLKENAEYHAAREQQSFMEGRIMEIEGVLSMSQEIDISKLNAGDRVVFGATVTLQNEKDESLSTYQIVGEYEANPDESKISVTSPIARALIGKNKDDSVVVKAPGGDIEYFIMNVEY